MGGYGFLMQNYRVGDRICLFGRTPSDGSLCTNQLSVGFSRGAYTARALAGMLTKVGLLPQSNTEQIPFAYKMYKRTDQSGVQQAADFKRTFCRSVGVEFIGVWETVSSTGVLMSRNLPFTLSNTSIRTFRQALALDEHRAKFIPLFCLRVPPVVETKATGEKKKKKKRAFFSSKEKRGRSGTTSTAGSKAQILEVENEPSFATEMDVKEVWFAGVHSGKLFWYVSFRN